MNKMIIFDSDYINGNINNLDNYLKKFEGYSCFVTEISIEEVSYINYFNKIKYISELKNNVKNYESLGIDFKKNDDEIKTILLNKSKAYIKKLFNDNVINHHSRSSSDLTKRALNKIPPFGKSDTGYKDTLILLDIIDFIKGKKITNAFYISNDNDFIGNKDAIQTEVFEKTNCVFTIVDGKGSIEKILNYFDLGNTKEITDISEKISKTPSKNIDIKQLREDLQSVCYNLFYYEIYDYMGNNYDSGNNFVLTRYLNRKDILTFLDRIEKVISKNIFNNQLSISDFFDDLFLFKDESKIDISVFEKLSDIYNMIKDNDDYLDSLVNLLLTNFNNLIEMKDEDLPF